MSTGFTPITPANCDQVEGPFFHGTKARLCIGDMLATGHPSHFEVGRALKHVYFSSLMEPAIWAAELAMALSGGNGRGHVYVVEPTGPFEDDPNVTNKRFAGNPTQSYRSVEPLKIVAIVDEWQGHSEGALQGMLASLQDLRRRGLAIIED